MISWSTRYDEIGETNNFTEETCKVCSVHAKPVYKVEQAYFKLYGLSLFPTKKLYYKTCSNCQTKLKVREEDSNLRSIKVALPGKFKFKYVWGWLILLPIIFGILWLILEIKNH